MKPELGLARPGPEGFQDHYISEPSIFSEQAGRKSIDREDWTHPVNIPCHA
jgi:hypothetical protein